MAGVPQEILTAIIERIKATARVETIYGESRAVDGRSIIPVARLRYGFGGGGGQGPAPSEEGETEAPGGGGGGGGVDLSPVGFLVISPEGERFVPIPLRMRELAGAVLGGFLLGFIVARRIFPGHR